MTMRTLGRRLYDGWLAIAGHFGEIQTLVLVGVIYVFVIGPVASGLVAARRDLLAKRGLGERQTAWAPADTGRNWPSPPPCGGDSRPAWWFVPCRCGSGVTWPLGPVDWASAPWKGKTPRPTCAGCWSASPSSRSWP